MSRTFIAALIFSVSHIPSGFSQPLNINPFPVERAGTLSAKDPEILKQEPVEAFAEEAEEEILRLERENAELAEELKEIETKKQELERIEAEKLEQQKNEAQRSEQERLDELAREQKRKESLRLEQERIEAQEQENARLAEQLEQQKREEEYLAEQRRENAMLAKQLADVQKQKHERELSQEKLKLLEQEKQIAEQQSEVVSLKEKNQQLSDELRALTEERRIEKEARRKQAELEIALKEMEKQKRLDNEVQQAEQPESIAAVDPLFESASMADNPVKMTPMPGDKMALQPNDKQDPEILEVRASDLGLIEPSLNALDTSQANVQVAEVTPQKEVQPEIIDLGATKIKVLPYEDNVGVPIDVVSPARSFYRTAKAGESLEDVLRSWSQAEGVGFLWKTTQHYDVIQPVDRAKQNYAASVEALLGQYEGQSVRPIGKLHTDPVTGTTTLSVLSE